VNRQGFVIACLSVLTRHLSYDVEKAQKISELSGNAVNIQTGHLLKVVNFGRDT